MASETTGELTKKQARSQARLAEILLVANRHLAETGAASLSLRAIAREVGIVSSAIHRYFPTRDDLLTVLIVDAYDSLGQAAETSVAASRQDTPKTRWVAAAVAIRNWAVAEPHRWTLLYGTPVPGYAAPDRTVAPGARVSMALLSIVADATSDGRLVGPVGPAPAAPVIVDLEGIVGQIGFTVEPPTMLRSIAAWTQLFGLISFELFGQTKNLVSDDEGLFVAAVELMASFIGLQGPGA